MKKTDSKPRKRQASLADAEDKAAYHRSKNGSVVRIRLSPEESALLRSRMAELGATNVSRYIRYRLFGLHPEERFDRKIAEGDTSLMVAALAERYRSFVESAYYVRHRYEKDMAQLYREEGVDMKRWTSATNRWISRFSMLMEETVALQNRIAEVLHVEETVNPDFKVKYKTQYTEYGPDNLDYIGVENVPEGEETDADRAARELLERNRLRGINEV